MPDLSPAVRYVSLDVFDTVLTRNVYRPHDLHLRVQKRLEKRPLPGGVAPPADFKRQRLAAEVTAREGLKGRGEVTFEEIIAAFASGAGLSLESATAIAAYEVAEELNSVLPVGALLSLVTALRGAGKSIVYVSDMYLPGGVIRQMLERIGIWAPGDRLYVSAESGSSKRSGRLFRHVLDDLQIEPRQMIHLGDYLLSDFLMPRVKHRITSFPVRFSRDNIYERLWGNRCRCLYCSSLAGASRAARVALASEGMTPVETTLYNLGCNVLGPILASFALWVLTRAQQAGIRRLYFLSRDGEVILEAARRLAQSLELDLELRYLHVSRTAVFPAWMGHGVEPATIGWLKEPTIVLTVRIIADRLKVDAATLNAGLARAGLVISGIDDLLQGAVVDGIHRLLVSDAELNALLAVSGQQALQNLTGYLEQEELFDGTPSAVVDLGWHGGIQDVIYGCFHDRLGANGIAGFYFGVDLAGKPGSAKYGYFTDQRQDSPFHRFRHLFRVLIELLCSGSHGMVKSYRRREDGCYLPVLAEIEHQGNWERIKLVREGSRAFFGSLDAASIAGFDYQHVRPQILDVFRKLFFLPSLQEGLALGGLYFSADQAGHGLHRVAPPFSAVSAARFLARRSYAGRSSISSWFFASWTCSGMATRVLMYPLVWLLRILYGGSAIISLSGMRWVDGFNRLINVQKKHLRLQ